MKIRVDTKIPNIGLIPKYCKMHFPDGESNPGRGGESAES